MDTSTFGRKLLGLGYILVLDIKWIEIKFIIKWSVSLEDNSDPGIIITSSELSLQIIIEV